MTGFELVYLFAGIVGWPLILVMLFFGGDTDFDTEVDFDADMDFDADADFDADTDFDTDLDLDSGWGDVLTSMLSVRSMIFFVAFFGLVGFVLSVFLGASQLVSLISAIGVGLFGAYFNGRLTHYLKKSTVSSDLQRGQLEGSAGRVTVPVGLDHKGRIAIDVGGRPVNVVAKPYNARQAGEFAVGERIVVVELDDQGTALIARLDMLGQEDG